MYTLHGHSLPVTTQQGEWGGGVVAFCRYLPKFWINLIIGMMRKAECEHKIYIVPLVHLRDPHKTKQFSLQIEEYDEYGTTVSEKLHEACVSLKRDGYAFKIYYRSLEDSPIGEWTMRHVKGHIHCVLQRMT